MQFVIAGVPRDFIPIQTFRRAHGLPESFGVRLFEPKDYTGLGRIDGAGAELHDLRQAIIARLPEHPPRTVALLDLVQALCDTFRHKLMEINPRVGLREMEIDFAVAGFEGVTQAVAWAILRAEATKTAPPTFEAIYGDWLNDSIRVSQTVYQYSHQGVQWAIQVVNNAYGRAGLMIQTGDDTHYVYDAALACPAEGLMLRLFTDVAARL